MASNELKKIDYKKKQALEALESIKEVSDISAPEAENAVLGAMVIQSEAYHLVSSVLMPEFFSSEDNKNVYTAIVSLSDRGSPVDLITIIDELRNKGLSTGMDYVIDLSNKVNQASNIEFHARIIVDEYMKRSFLKVCVIGATDIRKIGSDPYDLLEQFKQDIVKIESKAIPSKSQPMNIAILDTLEMVTQAQVTGVSGTPWYNPVLDLKTGGLSDNELIFLGGLPSHGKTALMLSTIDAIANIGDQPVGGISYEMTKANIDHREMAILSGYVYGAIAKGKPSVDFNFIKQRIEQSQKRLSNIHFNYSYPTLRGLKAWIKSMKFKYGINRFFIDFLQKIPLDYPTGSPNTDNEIRAIELKNICRDELVTIVCLARLNDKVKGRDGKLPQEGDIYYGGTAESEADTIIFQMRPEMYDEYRSSGIYQMNGESIPCLGKTLLVCTKNRGGEPFTAWMNSDLGRHWFWGDRHPFPELATIHGLECDTPIITISKPKQEIIGVSDVFKTNKISGVSNFEHPF
jgi:replicative DNA helicase